MRFSVCIMLMAQLMTTAYADTSHVKVASNNSLAAVGICDSVTDVSQQECDALLIVYSEMGGQNWTNQAGWLTDTSVCSWFGITCDGIPSVRQINLPFNNMIGSIPVELGSFTNLKLLYLNSNHLVGSIPAELGNLTNLIQIELNHNQLSGSIPIELANMPILNTLYLHHNLLTGSIPAELGTMNNLLRLDLNHNQLSGSIPIELANMSALTSLYLHNNQLVGSIPAELGNMTILQNLFLYSNQLTGSIPTELGNMTALRNLALRDNQLSGSIPAELGNLANLQSLGLNINQLTGSIPKELGSLNNMYTLFLGSNQLSGSIPKELGSLSSLQALRLISNKLTGNIPVELGNLTELESGESVELGWNALYASDGILDSFLDTKAGEDWSLTQTVAPDDFVISGVGADSVTLSWNPIEYTEDSGGYRVWYSLTPSGPYSDAGITVGKSTSSFTVNGLNAGLYYFVVQAETQAHDDNTNALVSENSPEITALVTGPAVVTINNYEVTERFVETGTDVTFSWNVSNATECFAVAGTDGWAAETIELPTGETTLTLSTAGTFRYVLECNDTSNLVSMDLMITALDETNSVVINSFEATPRQIIEGEDTSLSWNVSNAVDCTPLEGQEEWRSTSLELPQGLSTQTIASPGCYTYTLQCTDGLHLVSESLNIEVKLADLIFLDDFEEPCILP
jgi:Leucine-rich repeat (LRR) protein/plastocyanin